MDYTTVFSTNNYTAEHTIVELEIIPNIISVIKLS